MCPHMKGLSAGIDTGSLVRLATLTPSKRDLCALAEVQFCEQCCHNAQALEIAGSHVDEIAVHRKIFNPPARRDKLPGVPLAAIGQQSAANCFHAIRKMPPLNADRGPASNALLLPLRQGALSLTLR